MVVSSMTQRPCRLVRLNPGSGTIEQLGVIQEICGETDPELVPQTKVHTQIVVDNRGRLWFGTDSDELFPADAGDWNAAASGTTVLPSRLISLANDILFCLA